MPKISQLNNLPAGYDTDGGELLPVTINNAGTLQTFKIPASTLKGGEAYTLMTQMSSQYLSGHWVSRNTNDIASSNSGNVGIGTDSPHENLQIAQSDSGDSYVQFTNSTTSHSASRGFHVGIDATEQASLWQYESGSMVFGVSDAEKMRITNAGNVGIGTTAPGEKLDVAGNIAMSTGNANIGTLWNDGYGGGVQLLRNDATATRWAKLGILDASGNFVNGVTVLDSGNVGIGTETPDVPLTVVGIISANNIIYSNYEMRINKQDGSDGWHFNVDNSTKFLHIAESEVANRVTLDTNGRVGIGTTAPATALHIEHSTLADLRMHHTGGPTLNLSTNDGAGKATIQSDGTLSIQPAGDVWLARQSGLVGIGTRWPDEKLSVVGSISASGTLSAAGGGFNYFAGDVGIGTSMPSRKLEIVGTNGDGRIKITNTGAESSTVIDMINDDADSEFGIYASASDAFQIWHGTTGAGAARFTIQTGGNVGIGTTAPTSPLHVESSEDRVADFSVTDATAYIQLRDSLDSLYISSDTTKGSFGGNAGAHANNLNVDLTSGHVGIGTTTPIAPLHVKEATSNGLPLIALQKGSEIYSMTKHATTANLSFSGNSVGMGYDFYDEHEGLIMTIQKGVSGMVAIGCVPDQANALTVNGSISANNLIMGRSEYINFNVVKGSGGYGIRDNGGTVEAKHEGGTWVNILTSAPGGGGGGSGTVNSGAAKKLAYYPSAGTTVDDAVDVYVGDGTYLSVGADSFDQAMFTVKGTLSATGVSTFGSNVGIGTDSPTTTLHVSGAGPDILLENQNAGALAYQIKNITRTWHVGSDNSPDHFFIRDDTETANRLVINSAGQVGIGTAAPTNHLHILDSATGGTFLAVENTSTGGAEWRLQSSGSGNTAGAGTLAFNEEGVADHVVIKKTTGSVGIGTTAPQLVKLDVTGAIGQSGAVWATGARANSLVIDNNAGNARLHAVGADATTMGSFDFFTAETDGGETSRMTIKSDGKVGIGTGAPDGLLHVKSDGADAYLYVEENGGGKCALIAQTGQGARLRSSHELIFDTSNSEVARFDTSGNLGIGTTAPNYNLHISHASSPQLVLEDTTNSVKARLGADNSYAYIGAASNHSVKLLVNNADQGILTTTGLGLGNIAPEAKLHVTGSGYFTSDVVASYGSDERLKDNVTRITSALDKVDRISGYTFNWNDKANPLLLKHHYNDVGVIAQEVEEVMPEAVVDRDDGYKAVRYERLVPLLIESIKELKAEIEELKKSR